MVFMVAHGACAVGRRRACAPAWEPHMCGSTGGACAAGRRAHAPVCESVHVPTRPARPIYQLFGISLGKGTFRLSGSRIKRDKDAVSEVCSAHVLADRRSRRSPIGKDAVSRRSSARSNLFHLVEAHLDGGLAAAD